MSQITLQGKQQALIRVAESRVAALDAISATQEHASRCVQALPVSPATLKRVGVAVAAAASVVGVMSGLRKRKLRAERNAANAFFATPSVLLQLISPLLLPLVQQFLQKNADKQKSAGQGQQIGF